MNVCKAYFENKKYKKKTDPYDITKFITSFKTKQYCNNIYGRTYGIDITLMCDNSLLSKLYNEHPSLCFNYRDTIYDIYSYNIDHISTSISILNTENNIDLICVCICKEGDLNRNM